MHLLNVVLANALKQQKK